MATQTYFDLLQENNDRLLQEDGASAILLETGQISDHVADTLALVEGTEHIRGLYRAYGDTLAITDATHRAWARAIADTVAFADANDYILGLIKTITDTLALGDANLYKLTITKIIADTLAATEAILRRRELGRLINETTALEDDYHTAATFQRILAETLAILAQNEHLPGDVKVITSALAIAAAIDAQLATYPGIPADTHVQAEMTDKTVRAN